MDEIYNQSYRAVKELIEASRLTSGNILIVGCSTSEVCGSRIGTNSSEEAAESLFGGIYAATNESGVYLAVQCCEHLNRAIVVEKEAVPSAEYVNVVPQKKAGGSLATKAYRSFSQPVVVESIKADAGIDIGGTLIGMHLKQVAVPVRLSIDKIGCANIICARTRPKFIGGERAIYNKDLL
ncbi:MAG: TIGR01440 family protein [Candidatus Coproplasma sp.]